MASTKAAPLTLSSLQVRVLVHALHRHATALEVAAEKDSNPVRAKEYSDEASGTRRMADQISRISEGSALKLSQ